MRKATLLTFWVASLVFTVVGVYLAAQIPLQEWESAASLQSPVVIPVFLLLVALVTEWVAWIGALVLAGRLGAWGWFVAVFVLGSFGVLLLMIFGPDEFTTDSAYLESDEYGDFNDYGGMPS